MAARNAKSVPRDRDDESLPVKERIGERMTEIINLSGMGSYQLCAAARQRNSRPHKRNTPTNSTLNNIVKVNAETVDLEFLYHTCDIAKVDISALFQSTPIADTGCSHHIQLQRITEAARQLSPTMQTALLLTALELVELGKKQDHQLIELIGTLDSSERSAIMAMLQTFKHQKILPLENVL